MSGQDWHAPEGGFRNPPGSVLRGGDKRAWRSFMWRRLVAKPPEPVLPPGHVLDEAAVRQGIADLGTADGLTWLGHSCFLIQLAGKRILTDPFLSRHASPVPPLGPRRYAGPGLTAEQLPPIDLVLLSHNHYDHMDLPALRIIAARSRPVLVTALGVGRYLRGLPLAALHELDWHASLAVDALAVTAMPALHFSKRTFFDRNQTLWCGFRLEAGGHSLYFAGDTAFGPVFAEAAARHPPVRTALVPIGAYAPRALMQAGHCDPDEAVAIGRIMGARRLVPMHWGTIQLTDEPVFEPPELFQHAAIAQGYAASDLLIPAIGQTMTL